MRLQFVAMGKSEVFDRIEDVPYAITGYTEDLSDVRANGGFCHNPILDNQPIFEGFLSPMLDGGMLRYETQEVYDLMFN